MADGPTFTIYGKAYPFVLPSDFTLGEMNLCENHFGASFDNDELNARRVSSVLYVSMHRVDPAVTPAAIEKFGPDELAEFNRSLAEHVTDENEQVPLGNLPGASSELAPTEPSSDGEPADSTPAPDPNDSGEQSSEPVSRSVRPTLVT